MLKLHFNALDQDMRIAFIVTHFPALSETFILDQITGLIDRGHEVDIYADNAQQNTKIHPNVEKYNLLARTYYRHGLSQNLLKRWLRGLWLLGSNFYKAPAVLRRSLAFSQYGKFSSSLLLLFATVPFLDQRPYDIIHCHFGPNGVRGTLLREIGVFEGKLITTFYGYDVSLNYQKANKRSYEKLFAQGNLFLVLSQLMKDQLINLDADEKKILVHRLGINCGRFSFTPRQLSSNSKVRLITIARLTEKKGVEYSIRAIAKLANHRYKIEYNIVGDGPLRRNLQQLIQELDIGDQVKLLGWKQQQEVIEILNNSHILLAPSVTTKGGDQEGTPVVLMEAMAMGLPVISTLHSGIPEVVKDGVSGFLVPERDVDTLADKLHFLIQHPEIWSEMGHAGRSYVEQHYNIEKQNDQLVEIYQNLLK